MYDTFHDKKDAAIHMVENRHMDIYWAVRCVALVAVLVFATLPASAASEPECPGIHVDILNIKNSTGTIGCALFESPEGFPFAFMRFATHIIVLKIQDTKARCDFVDIPPGTYALGVIHDENMNGELDTNWLGIPTEGYGFSNEAKATLSPPAFSAAAFSYEGQDMSLSIRLDY